MKKAYSTLLFIVVFAVQHLSFTVKNTVRLKSVLGICSITTLVGEVKAQNIFPLTYADISNKRYYLLRYNTPGTTPTTAIWDIIYGIDTIVYLQHNFRYDTLVAHPATWNNNNYLLSLDHSSGWMGATSFSNVTIPYSQLTGTPSIPSSQVNSDWNSSSGLSEILNKPTLFPGITPSTGISVTNGSVITNTAPDQVITLTAGNNEIEITGTYPNFVITPYIPTTYTVSRAINSSTFQISSTRRASAIYNVGISCTASIGSNAAGQVQLQYSTDGGSTWLNASRVKNSNQVTLAIALQSVNDNEMIISIRNIAAGTRLRLVPTSSGTTTITSILGFETY